MAILLSNPGFEAVSLASVFGKYQLTGMGVDLTYAGWVFEQTAVVYADSYAEFSGTQGHLDWTYGYTTDFTDPGLFVEAETFTTQWEAAGVHVSQTTLLSTANLAIRRWTSDVTGTLWFSGFSRNTNGTSGTILEVCQNGVSRLEEAFAVGELDSRPFIFSLAVEEGDAIDFVNAGVDEIEMRVSIFSGSQAGIVRVGSAYAPAALLTGQAAMIQGTGRFHQDITFAVESRIYVKFKALTTAAFTLGIEIDGITIDFIDVNSPSGFTTFQSGLFDWSAGTHQISFQAFGDDLERVYIDDVSIGGIFHLAGTEDSGSIEDEGAGGRGRTAGETSISFEISCHKAIYHRAVTEGSASIENRATDLGDGRDPRTVPDPSIGHGPWSGSRTLNAIGSEWSLPREAYKLYKNLQEVRSFCDPVPPLTNIALNKTATSSSIHAPTTLPRYAVDGSYEFLSVYPSAAFHSEIEASPWWDVDLGRFYIDLEYINLWNTDSSEERLVNFYVFISDTPFTSNDPSVLAADPTVWTYFQAAQALRPSVIPVGHHGRYVRVQLSAVNFLHMAEVEVFGR